MVLLRNAYYLTDTSLSQDTKDTIEKRHIIKSRLNFILNV